MKKSRIHYLALIGVILLLSSCASPKKIVYFWDQEGEVKSADLIDYQPRIQPGDELKINISGLNMEAALPFNLYEVSNSTNAQPVTYIVSEEGKVNFPVLGEILVKNSTTKEISDKLTELLVSYIKDPIVTVRLVNFKIAVLGEVENPGTYPVTNERVSILDALGMAGDLTIHGKRENVLLIREKDKKRTYIKLDLTKHNFFNSPYFYLAQNDVLYVEPNKTKVNSSSVGANTGVIISSISILISLVAILLR
ncbi:polysaccharide export protein [Lutibacter sp. HS1-25]|uniref:polysaccharide biosynthesis/export family protein n=1 Tax=Lutibacter sp. HS1-25 TaxID=2485000 RepID=UPI001010AC2F|nr:polysaccharide biosynthesis/export family protein [Lutibacter sp. HS1-25]RXP61859.1 polysaccharide export protein [Lutibacter sp. HS1-25]